jgi:putative oxygen-independent coproporphyrinogen III oxidase
MGDHARDVHRKSAAVADTQRSTLENTQLKALLEPLTIDHLRYAVPVPLESAIPHLYVHVPFCPSICPYCDFHVLTRHAGAVEAYLRELENDARQLETIHGRHALETLYIGGGTPSFLRDAELETLVGIVRAHFGWASLEATLEVNPGTVSKARAELWRELGFTRASVGVQSTQDDVLKFLGRTHDSRQAFAAINTLREAGLHVSADLITAVPGQDLERDLRALGALGLEHISCYTLTIEEGTPFHRQGVIVNEDDESKALELAEPILESFGLQRYEISNHAKPGLESRHNLAYWRNRFYFGLGAGAAGHYPALNRAEQIIAERRTNPHLGRWLEGERGELELITRIDFVTDALFSGLRLRSGIDIAELSNRAGLDVKTHFEAAFEDARQKNWLEWHDQTVRCTRAGWWVLNRVVSLFLT